MPDGDTITALDADAGKRQHKILLHQIDAPEQNQDYGMHSNQSLYDLVSGRTMSMEVIDIERYGRTVGKLLIGSTDANLEQVKRGMAWVYVKYARQQPFRAD